MAGNTENSKNGSDEAKGTNEKHCYICWDDSNDGELGELRRDCGCRGENGYAHLPCLITAKNASAKSLDPLTRSWLKCNQCQVPYADPTKSYLSRELEGENSLLDRVGTVVINLLEQMPSLIRMYTALTICMAFYFLIGVLIGVAITLLGPYVKRLYQESSLESRVICALLVGTICWKFRHPLYSFIRMCARELARRAGREVYFNFWFAAEGIGANNLSVWTKLGAFATLVGIGYLRIRDRGTFDFPFHGRPRRHQDESRLQKMTKYLTFYTKEMGYWAIFDTYWTVVAVLFLVGWAAYLFIVQRVIAVSLLTYENIQGERVLDTLQPFFEDSVIPWFKWVLQFPIFDDFWEEHFQEQIDFFEELDQEWEDQLMQEVDQKMEVYAENDSSVERVMEDTREHNYWWCCM